MELVYKKIEYNNKEHKQIIHSWSRTINISNFSYANLD